MPYSDQFVKKVIAACREYRSQLDEATRRICELEKELAEADQTIEDVCCSGRLICPKCGKSRPCCCQDLGK